MTRLVIIIATILSCMSCQSIRYVPIVQVRDSIITSPVDTLIIPPDSASIKALLECDENGRAILRSLESSDGERMRLQLQLDSLGNLLVKARSNKGQQLKPQKPVIIYQDRPVPYPVETQLTKWEKIKMQAGGYTIVVASILIIIGGGKLLWK